MRVGLQVTLRALSDNLVVESFGVQQQIHQEMARGPMVGSLILMDEMNPKTDSLGKLQRSQTQRAQYGFIKEYGLNHILDPYIILVTFLH